MKRVLCLTAVAVGLVGSAVAAPKINFTGMGLSGQAFISGTSLLPGGTYSHTVNTGQMNFFYDANGNDVQNLPTDVSFIGFCLTPKNILQDPTTLDASSPFIWDTTDGSRNSGYGVNAQWDMAARLFQHAWTVQDDNANAAAAFQLALWNIMSSSFTYATNAPLVNATVQSYYTNFMATANNASLSGKMVLFKPVNFPSQSQLIATHLGGGGGGFTPVPEPFTMGLGLAAAGAFVRRRMKAKKTV